MANDTLMFSKRTIITMLDSFELFQRKTIPILSEPTNAITWLSLAHSFYHRDWGLPSLVIISSCRTCDSTPSSCLRWIGCNQGRRYPVLLPFLLFFPTKGNNEVYLSWTSYSTALSSTETDYPVWVVWVFCANTVLILLCLVWFFTSCCSVLVVMVDHSLFQVSNVDGGVSMANKVVSMELLDGKSCSLYVVELSQSYHSI